MAAMQKRKPGGCKRKGGARVTRVFKFERGTFNEMRNLKAELPQFPKNLFFVNCLFIFFFVFSQM